MMGVKMESSVGAAARQVRFTTPESYAKEVYAAAAGSGADPAKQTADHTASIAQAAQRILHILTNPAGAVANSAGEVAAAARDSWMNPGELAANAATGGIYGAAKGMIRGLFGGND